MPQQTKIFRVFVSSTFTDMRLERGILQRDAFPRLEKFCEENEARFQAVDLRWGVNEESALDQKTLQICFKEIARCQKISPKPNFLILLGDKYGWQPIPEIIPKDEMDAIITTLIGDDKTLNEKWYWLDSNAIPAEYVLQPRGDKYKEYKDWETVEIDIRNMLRKAVNALNFTTEQKYKYFSSATHQEILKGALDPGNKDTHPEKHVFAFSRKIKELPYDISAKDFIDLTNEKLDIESKAKLDKLKNDLSTKLGSYHFREYTGEWKDGTLKFTEKNLKAFNDQVYEELEKVIKDQLGSVSKKDDLLHEIKLHYEFKIELTKHFQGRKEALEKISNYIQNKSEKRVMSIIGDPGSGKSSLMAQAVKRVSDDNGTGKNGTVLAYRFIGTTSGSSNIMSLIQNICDQIAKEYGKDAKKMGRDGDEKASFEMNGLSDIFKQCLALATPEKPILVFLDSLDQLSETDSAKALYWLPREMPENARMIVSSLPELESKLNATYLEIVSPLTEQEANDILNAWLNSIKRKLTDEQHRLVINSCVSNSKLPLYLKLAFEKAKKWHSYDNQHTLKENVEGIINDYFVDLEKEHTEEFVRNAICYMLCGRYNGLTENEILEILAFDNDYWKIFLEKNKYHSQDLIDLKKEIEDKKDEQKRYMKIPIAAWSRLHLDLEPFLTERDADGVPIITFFHRQFNEVLRKRYQLVKR